MQLNQKALGMRGILSDGQIKSCCESGMITPYIPNQSRLSQYGNMRIVSKGLSCYGYDISLAAHDFQILKPNPWYKKVFNWLKCLVNTSFNYPELDPKESPDKFYQPAILNHGYGGDYFVIPPHSYALGVSVERFTMPANLTGIAIGKSTYARIGLICNLTPLEAGWNGYLTLEFNNPTHYPIRIYANEGCAQVLFLAGEQCDISYADKQGKYQNQSHTVTHARI